jgi:hypothetical protein
MAKKAARTKKAAPPSAPVSQSSDPPKQAILAPQKVHELFALPGPYDPPGPPIATMSFITWWDCGISINELRRRQKTLFCGVDWLDGQRFAKDSDSWKWRLLNLTPIGLGETFEEQVKKISHGDEPPMARELVTYLVLHFLASGERLEIPRLRCKDVLSSGRRVVVGPFREDGLEIANVSDRWSSPGIALSSLFTPVAKKK